MTGDASAFKLVVVGADGSDGSDVAMQWTAQTAAATASEVLAVCVLTYSREFLRDLSVDTVHAWRRALETDLEDSWTEALRASGVRYRCQVVEADSAAQGLIDAANQAGADLLVVGTNGHGSLVGRVLGGVSYRIAHHADQPVVVVPATWVAPASKQA